MIISTANTITVSTTSQVIDPLGWEYWAKLCAQRPDGGWSYRPHKAWEETPPARAMDDHGCVCQPEAGVTCAYHARWDPFKRLVDIAINRDKLVRGGRR